MSNRKDDERTQAMATGALIGLNIAQARRESKHHQEQVALQRQVLAQQASIKRAQVEAQARALRSLEASQKRSETELKRQTAIQERQAALTAEHEFALWRQTPDGRAFLQWVDDKNKLIDDMRSKEKTYIELSIEDDMSTAKAEQLDAIDHILDPVYPPRKPKVPTAQYVKNSRTVCAKWLMGVSPLIVIIPILLHLVSQHSPALFESALNAATLFLSNHFGFWLSLLVAIVVLIVGFFLGEWTPVNEVEIEERTRELRDWGESYGTMEKIKAYQVKVKRQRAHEATRDFQVPLTVSDDGYELVVAEVPHLWEGGDSYISHLEKFEKWGQVHHPSPDKLPDLRYPEIKRGVRAFAPRTRQFVHQIEGRVGTLSEVPERDPSHQIEASD